MQLTHPVGEHLGSFPRRSGQGERVRPHFGQGEPERHWADLAARKASASAKDLNCMGLGVSQGLGLVFEVFEVIGVGFEEG
jgi:hypothetical protein